MKAIVIYESMFGNTRAVAEAIADGLRQSGQTRLTRVHDVTDEELADADVLVIGAPTHAHGMPQSLTRKEAARQAADPDAGLALEPYATSTGVREWVESHETLPNLFAAFDTRADAFRWLTGSAATHLSKLLRHRGLHELTELGSFLSPDNDTDLSEIDRAREWGTHVGSEALVALTARSERSLRS